MQPPPQPAIDCQQMAQTMGAAVAAGIQASQPPSVQKVPKAMRGITNPGHDFDWASNPNTCPALCMLGSSLSVADQHAVVPQYESQLEAALSEVKPTALLRGFERLITQGGDQVQALDFVVAYTALLSKLVAAVGATPDKASADRAASKYLWEALAHTSRVADPQHVHTLSMHKRAYIKITAEHRSPPATPSSLLRHLAEAFVPSNPFEDREDDYRRHLQLKYDCTTSDSVPRLVLEEAKRIACVKHLNGTAAWETEAKRLFVAWVKHWKQQENVYPMIAKAIHPLLEKVMDPLFLTSTLLSWEQTLQLMEGSNGSLEGFVKSLLPSKDANKQQQSRRAPAVHSVQGGGSSSTDGATATQQQQPSSSSAPTPPQAPAIDVKKLAGDIVPYMTPLLQQQFQAHQLSEQAVANVLMPQIDARFNQMMRAQQPAVQHTAIQQSPPLPVQVYQPQVQHQPRPPPQTQFPAGPTGLRGNMANNFVAAQGSPEPVVQAVGKAMGPIAANHPAFMPIPAAMDHAWCVQFGCIDLGPAPGTKVADRIWIDVPKLVEACNAAGWNVETPQSFKAEPHVGGASCPFDNWIAQNQGFAPINWYLHPNDKMAAQRGIPADFRKPKGRDHQWDHQVYKCAAGLAMQHVLCRMDRDAGRGDINAHLFRVQKSDIMPAGRA